MFEVPFRNYDYRLYYPWWTEAPIEVAEKLEPLTPRRSKAHVVYDVHNPDDKNIHGYERLF